MGKHPQVILAMFFFILDKNNERPDWMTPHDKKMHVKEIYVIFIHLFDSGILLITDLNKKKGKKGGGGG